MELYSHWLLTFIRISYKVTANHLIIFFPTYLFPSDLSRSDVFLSGNASLGNGVDLPLHLAQKTR